MNHSYLLILDSDFHLKIYIKILYYNMKLNKKFSLHDNFISRTWEEFSLSYWSFY